MKQLFPIPEFVADAVSKRTLTPVTKIVISQIDHCHREKRGEKIENSGIS